MAVRFLLKRALLRACCSPTYEKHGYVEAEGVGAHPGDAPARTPAMKNENNKTKGVGA